MSALDTLASIAKALVSPVAAFVARSIGLTPGPDLVRLKGPPHVYAAPGTLPYRKYGASQCLGCPRVDTERTPLTDPPCARTRIWLGDL